MPVEHEHIAFPNIESQRLALLVQQQPVSKTLLPQPNLLGQSYHGPVELGQKTVLQHRVVLQMPLAAGITVRPPVLLPREIYPFRMPELIAHEVQVPTSFRPHKQREQSYHLVQCHPPVHHRARAKHRHIRVHLRPHQAESQRLIPHQSLVVTLRIGNLRHGSQTVVHRGPKLGHHPILVLALLEQLDPIVRNAHRQTIIETDAARSRRSRHPRHPAHLLGNAQMHTRPHRCYQIISQRQIYQRIAVNLIPKVILVGTEIVHITPMEINHGRHPVETETVKMEFLHPVTQVRQQETPHLVTREIEHPRPPVRMGPRLAPVAIQIIAPVQAVQALVLVLHKMRMHHVHHHADAHPVRLPYQSLQVVGRAEAGRRRKEIRHMVAETAVIRVLGNPHQLQYIIPRFFYPGQDIGGKFRIRPHAFLFLRHPHMRLVNQRSLLGKIRSFERGFGIAPTESLLRSRHPDLGLEILALRILHRIESVSRHPHGPSAVAIVNIHLVPCAMPKPRHVLGFHSNFPDPVLYPMQGMGSQIPGVEIPYQEHMAGMRQPFAEHPFVRIRFIMQAKVLVGGSKIIEASPFLLDPGTGTEIILVAAFNLLSHRP